MHSPRHSRSVPGCVPWEADTACIRFTMVHLKVITCEWRKRGFGQKEKLCCDAVLKNVSTDPSRSSTARVISQIGEKV